MPEPPLDARESKGSLAERARAFADASAYAMLTCVSFWFAVIFGPVASLLSALLVGLGLYRGLRRSLAVALLFSPMMFGHMMGLLAHAERNVALSQRDEIYRPSDYRSMSHVIEVALVDLEPMCRKPSSPDDATFFGGRWLVCWPYHVALRPWIVLDRSPPLPGLHGER
jgi:hypothetical protein